MHYSRAVTVLALLAVGACSGDRVLRPAPKTIVRGTVWWMDKAGQRQQIQLPDHSMPQIFIRGRPQMAAAGPPEKAVASTATAQVTDAAGNLWRVSATGYSNAPPTNTTAATGDTATYSQAMTWTATDTGWALSVLTITVSTSTVSGGGSVKTLPHQTMARPRVTRLLALGQRCVTALTAALLPQTAEARAWCISQWINLIGSDILFAGAVMGLAAEPFNPIMWMAYWGAAALVAGAEQALYECRQT